MTHWSPLRVWMVATCKVRGYPDPEHLSPELAKKLKEEFDKQNQPPQEAKEPAKDGGVP